MKFDSCDFPANQRLATLSTIIFGGQNLSLHHYHLIRPLALFVWRPMHSVMAAKILLVNLVVDVSIDAGPHKRWWVPV